MNKTMKAYTFFIIVAWITLIAVIIYFSVDAVASKNKQVDCKNILCPECVPNDDIKYSQNECTFNFSTFPKNKDFQVLYSVYYKNDNAFGGFLTSNAQTSNDKKLFGLELSSSFSSNYIWKYDGKNLLNKQNNNGKFYVEINSESNIKNFIFTSEKPNDENMILVNNVFLKNGIITFVIKNNSNTYTLNLFNFSAYNEKPMALLILNSNFEISPFSDSPFETSQYAMINVI